MVPLCFIFDAIVNDIIFLILIFNYSLIVFRITLDLCRVILNPETLIKSLFNPGKFMISLNMHRLVSCQRLKSYFIWISAHSSLRLFQFLLFRLSLNTLFLFPHFSENARFRLVSSSLHRSLEIASWQGACMMSGLTLFSVRIIVLLSPVSFQFCFLSIHNTRVILDLLTPSGIG